MVTKPITLRPDTDVFVAIDTLIQKRISGAPVLDEDNRFLGVFSEGCAINLLLAAAWEDAPSGTIERFIERDAPTISPETDLLTVAQTFLHTTSRRLPVLVDGRLVGQVSRRDLLKAAGRLLEMGRSESSSVLYLGGTDDDSDSAILVAGRK